jgi:hypothetical protein
MINELYLCLKKSFLLRRTKKCSFLRCKWRWIGTYLAAEILPALLLLQFSLTQKRTTNLMDQDRAVCHARKIIPYLLGHLNITYPRERAAAGMANNTRRRRAASGISVRSLAFRDLFLKKSLALCALSVQCLGLV